MFLGLDCSTQSLKGLLINPDDGEVLHRMGVNFEEEISDFPAVFTPEGDSLARHADPRVWLAALDRLCEKFVAAGIPLREVRGIGGCGQQHGTVYLKASATAALAHLDPAQDLATQLAPHFSRDSSPIWMDSSTTEQCVELTEQFGQRLQWDTGSPATERFAGPQIRKWYQNDPDAYAQCDRIHLVSSFMASVWAGRHAPIDYGDGAGMNLLDLHSLQWDSEICEATAPGLVENLPSVASTTTIVGGISPYYVTKYGFFPDAQVSAWTGDNPASLIGMGGLRPDVAVVSLGTSDTFFAAMDAYHTDPEGNGHVFGHPAGGFLCLTCFKNGSLARERIRDALGVDWQSFDQTAFEETPPGNENRLALPWYEPEITPFRPDAGLRANFSFVDSSHAVCIRAVIEGQILSMRLHSRWIGDFGTIRVTGGASRSTGMLQVLADVFQATVETISLPDSAALGGAMIAARTVGGYEFGDLVAKLAPAEHSVRPNRDLTSIYEDALEACEVLEG